MHILSIRDYFLGFILTTDVVKIDLSRVLIIKDWPLLKSFHDIQVFLEFANFYYSFIREFLRIVEELTTILKGSLNGKF